VGDELSLLLLVEGGREEGLKKREGYRRAQRQVMRERERR